MAQADSQNSTAIGGATALPVSSVNSAQTRRTVIGAFAGATGLMATAAVLPVAALSAESDPIFPAIEAWREAHRCHDEKYDKHGWDKSGNAEKTCHAYHDAAKRMCEVQPTTVAGAAALAEILTDDISRGDNEWHAIGFASAARALRAMVGGQPFADVEKALADLEHDRAARDQYLAEREVL